MQLALVDNVLTEAQPNLNGICPGCDQPVISKCGEIYIWHWSHKKSENCDDWWEAETPWHRQWKNHFPSYCHEKFLFNKDTREKHIADIVTQDGFVIEFQNSFISSSTIRIREEFYGDMVWVVNANMKKDANGHFKFFKQNPAIRDHVYDIIEPSAYFPARFSRSIVPVIFDYSDCNDIAECDRNDILCLLPKIRGNISRVIQNKKEHLY